MENEWTTVIKPKNKLLDLNLKELWEYKDLIWMFVKRDFKTMYKQTILGPLWIVINPILTTLMQVLVFGNIAGISTDGMPQFLFYMANNTLWLYFSGCLLKTSNTFIANSGVFGKVYFPRLVTPISIIISGLVSFGVQFLMFLVAMMYYMVKDIVQPTPALLLVPLFIVVLALLGMGCGIIISALTTKYRDLAVLVSFGVQLWMYGSAIIFPASSLSEKWINLLMLNPVVPIVEGFRFAFTGHGIFEAHYIIYSCIITCFVLFVGIVLFNKIEKTFMDTV